MRTFCAVIVAVAAIAAPTALVYVTHASMVEGIILGMLFGYGGGRLAVEIYYS